MIAALLGVMLALSAGATAAQAKPAKAADEPVSAVAIEAEQAEQGAQEAEEAQEVAEEAAEVAEETGAAPQTAVGAGGVSKQERHTNARQINRLTLEIRHLRHVKERIRAKIRELRELPRSSPRRQRGQLGRAREKLLKKRRRLFHLQEERSELKHP